MIEYNRTINTSKIGEIKMDTVMKVKKWLFWLILIIAITSLLTWAVTLRHPIDVNYEVMFEEPQLIINEINATDVRVNIDARITNTTGDLIERAYLEFEFFNENRTLLRTERQQLSMFAANQTMNVSLGSNVRNADNIEVRFIEAEIDMP